MVIEYGETPFDMMKFNGTELYNKALQYWREVRDKLGEKDHPIEDFERLFNHFVKQNDITMEDLDESLINDAWAMYVVMERGGIS